MYVLAILLVGQVFLSDGFDTGRAIITEEVSESRFIADDSKGDVDETLSNHCPLPTDIYLSKATRLLQPSDINDFALPIRARAPPLA